MSSEIVVQVVLDGDGLTFAVRVPVRADGASPHALGEIREFYRDALGDAIDLAAPYLPVDFDPDDEATEDVAPKGEAES